MKRLLFLIFLTHVTYAKEPVQAGTFSLATEAGWGAAFELKNNGKATIIPKIDAENEDGSTNASPKVQRVDATWREVKDGIEISYRGHRDRLRLERECSDWAGYPCFRYEKSVEGLKEESLLKFDLPFINWDWKKPTKGGPVKKYAVKACRDNCEKMLKDHSLKEGMDLEQCIKLACQ